MRKLKFSAILFSVFAILISVLFGTPQPVSAACNGNGPIVLSDCLLLSNGQTVANTYKTPADLINVIVRNMFVVGGLILFAMIIYAGYLFISGGEKGIEQAQSVITTALIGFLIMFCSFWILRIIKVVTGADILF